jgi:peptidoglycan hydrolase CwlO-like protein
MSADLLTKEGIELELAQVQRRFDELALESNAVQNRLTEIQQEQQGLRGQHAMLQRFLASAGGAMSELEGAPLPEPAPEAAAQEKKQPEAAKASTNGGSKRPAPKRSSKQRKK